MGTNRKSKVTPKLTSKKSKKSETWSITKYIVLVSLIIALLAYTKFFKDYSDNKSKREESFVGTSFYTAHVLDPTTDGFQFTSWSRGQWITWLSERQKIFQRINPRGTPLPEKCLNSVIIGSRSEVLNAFRTREYPYYMTNNKGQMYWSESLFPSIVFSRNGKTTRVYRCPPMYIAVKLVNDFPFHLHEQSKRRIIRDYKVKLGKDCEEVN